MAKSRELGKEGESLAVSFLQENGYEILETNWRFSRAEIDIIAKDSGVLVFVEVKTRSNISFGRPEEFVTNAKEKLMIDAASQYMETINYEWEVRFDIISVFIPNDKSPVIQHFKDVFF